MSATQAIYIGLRSTTGAWFCDPALRDRLLADAEADGAGSSLSAVVTRILSATYGVAYEPTGRRGRPETAKDIHTITVMLPRKLLRAINVKAAANDRSKQDEIIRALSAHYGLAVPVVANRKGGRRAVAA